MYTFITSVCRDKVKRLATDLVVMRLSSATGHMRCALLINPNKLNLLSWLLAYVSDK